MVLVGFGLIALSIASFFLIGGAPSESVTLFLAYFGGIAMLLTP